jgi:hypothetical protein
LTLRATPIILGIDFDNTVACYEGLFYAAAVKLNLLPATVPLTRTEIRNRLLREGREDDFTRLQGHIYGPGLAAARPYPGLRDCLDKLKAEGAEIFIISHKTRHAISGPLHDLRRAAWRWLADNQLIAPGPIAKEGVFFEDTPAAKAARIAALGCTHFIDDMERFFQLPGFPAGVEKLLFLPVAGKSDPGGMMKVGGMARFPSWAEIGKYLTGSENDG